MSQPSMTGQASAKGSTLVRHQCVAPGCLRCVGRASPSFQAVDKLARNASTAGIDDGAVCAGTPCAAMSLSRCQR